MAGEVRTDAPLFRSVLFSLFALLCTSVVATAIADDLARREVNHIWILAGAGAAEIVFLWQLAAIHRRMKRDLTSPVHYQQHRKVIVNVAVFAFIIVAACSAIGYSIGASGTETIRLISDLTSMRTIGDRISKARTGAALTVPAQVDMYDSIASDVKAFSSVVARLRPEIQAYDLKYPAAHSADEETSHNIAIANARAKLLQREVDAAENIRQLEPDLQWRAWQEQMKPLLDEEDALDH